MNGPNDTDWQRPMWELEEMEFLASEEDANDEGVVEKLRPVPQTGEDYESR